MDIHFTTANSEDGSGSAFALVVSQLISQNQGSFDFRPGMALALLGGNTRNSVRTDHRAVPRLRKLGVEPVRVGKRWTVRVGDLAIALISGAGVAAPAPKRRGPKRRIATPAGVRHG